jgi:hypothetical protein
MTRSKKSPRAGPEKKSGSPSEVAPGIFVGGWKEALAFEGIRICVLDERPEDMPPASHVPVYDGENDRALLKNLDRIATEITDARAKGRPVLLFCGHGVRRSPLAAAWYLHRAEGLTLEEAYARIRSVRPQVEPANEWIGDPTGLTED